MYYTHSPVGLIPNLADAPMERHRTGLRPGSPAGVPFLVEHPEIKDLFANYGDCRNDRILIPASIRFVDCPTLRNTCILDPTP